MATQTYLDNKYNTNRKPYSTDITDEEWSTIEPLIPKTSGLGHKPTIPTREIMNAIFYIARCGGNWADLPHDFPSKTRVNKLFMKWRSDGTWEQINNSLNVVIRTKAGKEDSPSMLIVDSRTTKTVDKKKPSRLRSR